MIQKPKKKKKGYTEKFRSHPHPSALLCVQMQTNMKNIYFFSSLSYTECGMLPAWTKQVASTTEICHLCLSLEVQNQGGPKGKGLLHPPVLGL